MMFYIREMSIFRFIHTLDILTEQNTVQMEGPLIEDTM